jgi:hypothetical protein
MHWAEAKPHGSLPPTEKSRHLQFVNKAVIKGMDDAAISSSRPYPRSEGLRGDEDR